MMVWVMGGFDFSGQYMTQRMLASSFADDDGEIWQSVFGTDTPANVNEMSQSQLIKHMATRSYTNSDWLAKLGKLSTKGLVMEYLQQQAEINYMLAILKDLKLQSIQQEALLARVTTTGKDKNLDGLADSIHLNYNPNFMDIELGSAGDEWVGENVYVGGGGAGIDLSNLSDDINVLKHQLMEAIATYESRGSYNAYNKGDGAQCSGSYSGQAPTAYAPITQMTPAQIMTRYFGKVPTTVNEMKKLKGKVGCDRRIFAAGKYQWIPQTLWEMTRYPHTKHLLHKPFTPENQEELAKSFFTNKRAVMGQFLKGNATLYDTKVGIAQEWASIGAPAGVLLDKKHKRSQGCTPKACTSYYDGRGNNGAKYKPIQQVWAILEKIQQIRKSNVE